jgi:hypothetical protein
VQVRDFAASLFLEWSGDVADGDLMFDVSLDCCFLLLRISCDAISARLLPCAKLIVMNFWQREKVALRLQLPRGCKVDCDG